MLLFDPKIDNFYTVSLTHALKLLYRARYLSLLVLGESHPEVALIDSNIGLILHAVGEYDLSLKFLEKALELNLKFHGPKSLKVNNQSYLLNIVAVHQFSECIYYSLIFHRNTCC